MRVADAFNSAIPVGIKLHLISISLMTNVKSLTELLPGIADSAPMLGQAACGGLKLMLATQANTCPR